MKKNMGGIDRILRLVVAALIIVLYFMDKLTGTLGIVLLVVAGIFIITSIFSYCPLYVPFGINSCPIKESKEESN